MLKHTQNILSLRPIATPAFALAQTLFLYCMQKAFELHRIEWKKYSYYDQKQNTQLIGNVFDKAITVQRCTRRMSDI